MPKVAKVTLAQARGLYEKFCANQCETPQTPVYLTQGDSDPAWYESGPKLVRNLEESGTYGIAWEGGDYEWPFDEYLDNLAEAHEIIISPINHWAVAFYPA